MNKYANPHSPKGTAHKELKFYKHLKTYLCFIGFMFFAKIFLHIDINLYPIAFWWGFGIVIQYLRTFGWAGLQEQCTQQQQTYRYDVDTEPEIETFITLKQPQKAWRDRDLV